MSRESNREIVAFAILGGAAFLFVSIFSHDPMDYLLGEGRAHNVGGPAGGFVSFHLLRWLGKMGAYGTTAIVALAGLCLFFRRRIEQWGWKLVGAVLLIAVLSAFEVAVHEASPGAETLPGGYLGWTSYTFLLQHLSTFGTFLLLALTTLVALAISTDLVLYPAVERSRSALLDRQRWRDLRDKVRSMTPTVRVPALATIGGIASRLTSRSPGSRAGSGSRRKKGRASKSARRGGDAPASRAPRGNDLEDPLAVRIQGPAEGPGEDEEEPVATEPEPPEADEALECEEGEDEEYEYEYEYVEEDEEDEADEADEEDEEDGADGADEEPDDTERAPEGASRAESAGCESPDAYNIRLPEEEPKSRPKRKPRKSKKASYRLPSIKLVDPAPIPVDPLDRAALARTASKIETTLADFRIDARVVEVQKGPTITQFELSLAAGIKVHKIVNLADDLAMALEAQSIRIIAPIPGKSTVGIEVPNANRDMVGLRELIEAALADDTPSRLPLAMGRDTAGAPVVADLGEMPHLLIAGSTGSGKSVCINSVIVSVLLTRSPDEVKLILVDPKMVELAQFENIPHLLSPVVTDMKKAPAVLNWLVDKMEERYELLALAGVRHISSYNALGKEKLRERMVGKVDEEEMAEVPERLPRVVVIIDELADLMMTAAKEVESSITRLSQKSRAVGIHVILATQRPSVDVITGLIKANMPSRISFRVTSRVDSRTILDRNGAEKLLGKGDMLYLPPGTSDVMRVQGAYISEKEIRDIVQAAGREAEPQFNAELTRFGIEGAAAEQPEDDLFEDAVGIVLGSQRGSVTLLQRQLQIGYTRASRLMELMHEKGLVGPFKGSKAREVYYTLEDWQKTQKKAKKAESSD